MGAVECRSTRLCAYSGRRCKRAIGARRLAHELTCSVAGSSSLWSGSVLEVPGWKSVKSVRSICGCYLARPLLAFWFGPKTGDRVCGP